MTRSVPCLLVLAGVVHFSASPPVFPTCTKKCDECGARVCKGRNRAWGWARTSPPPSQLMQRWWGLVLTSPTVVKLRSIPAAAYWMRLIWGKVHLIIHSHYCASVSTIEISGTQGKSYEEGLSVEREMLFQCYSRTSIKRLSGQSSKSRDYWQ